MGPNPEHVYDIKWDKGSPLAHSTELERIELRVRKEKGVRSMTRHPHIVQTKPTSVAPKRTRKHKYVTVLYLLLDKRHLFMWIPSMVW